MKTFHSFLKKYYQTIISQIVKKAKPSKAHSSQFKVLQD